MLKNDGILPLKKNVKKLALIGPWANATTMMQGNYQGAAPFLISPLQGVINSGYQATYVQGTSISGTSDAGFSAAVAAAKAADVVIFAGGIDGTLENEANDRMSIAWPGNQLDLVSQLEATGKPLVVLQFGGGQVDDSTLKASKSVHAIIWGGYPGQSGGAAIFDIISGKAAPSGRLPTTQYPASYTDELPMTDMTVRPGSSSPGRTYMWYQNAPVFEFGLGLHFTTFQLSWQRRPQASYQISRPVSDARGHIDLAQLDTFNVDVKNTGKIASDYVALIFVSGTAGPAPHPNKRLVSYTRLHGIDSGKSQVTQLAVTLGAIARAVSNGNLWVYAGSYQSTVDTGSGLLTHSFTLTGNSVQITHFRQDPSSSS